MKDKHKDNLNQNLWIVRALQAIGFDFKQISSTAAKVNLATEILILAIVAISYLATKGETIVLYICSVLRPELIDKVNKQTSNTGLFAFLGFGLFCIVFVFLIKPYLENKKVIPPDFDESK